MFAGEEIEPTSTALFAQQRSTGLGQGQGRPLVIKPKPASRRAGEPPKPVEIERTSSFLISKRNQQEAGSNPSVGEKVHANPSTPGGISPEHDGEDPMSWVLRKTDQSLDAVEDNVPDVAKSAITFVTGNLGTTTSKVAVDAAKLAAKGGAKLFEVALPAGKWALSKGFGVVVSVAMKQQGKKNRRPQGKDDNANGTR